MSILACSLLLFNSLYLSVIYDAAFSCAAYSFSIVVFFFVTITLILQLVKIFVSYEVAIVLSADPTAITYKEALANFKNPNIIMRHAQVLQSLPLQIGVAAMTIVFQVSGWAVYVYYFEGNCDGDDLLAALFAGFVYGSFVFPFVVFLRKTGAGILVRKLMISLGVFGCGFTALALFLRFYFTDIVWGTAVMIFSPYGMVVATLFLPIYETYLWEDDNNSKSPNNYDPKIDVAMDLGTPNLFGFNLDSRLIRGSFGLDDDVSQLSTELEKEWGLAPREAPILSLPEVLESPIGRALLKEFMIKTLCHENILFYEELRSFRGMYVDPSGNIPDFDDFQTASRRLFERFIRQNSAPLWLNLSNENFGLFKTAGYESTDPIDIEAARVAWETAFSEVFSLMQEPFTRFRKTKQYRKFALALERIKSPRV
mmetsp:Transcript_10057/g.11431  ORF Transcript_10057/g.11431 Transcript_10057/m.11431 type:complete len:426 (+) Transcript_10057:1-1278(+)